MASTTTTTLNTTTTPATSPPAYVSVLDIRSYRNPVDVERIKQSQRQRYASVQLVDDIVTADDLWRRKRNELDTANMQLRIHSKNYGARVKAGQGVDDIKATIDTVKTTIKELEAEEKALHDNIVKCMRQVGNMVDPTVPVSDDEANNHQVTVWWPQLQLEAVPKTAPKTLLSHDVLLAKIGGYDRDRGIKVAGHRGYFLKGVAVELNMALVMYASTFLRKRGYELMQPPQFMFGSILAETAQLSDFEDSLYKVDAGTTDATEGDKFLIATSEQPISAFHRDEVVSAKELPLRYAGVSTCFRKEAGKGGQDTKGIFRVHQFEKVEQFVLCRPDQSEQLHADMLKLSEDFLQSLQLPYQVVTIVSGALNNAASKKYDIEGWFPASTQYRELVSCSNCTDYQSRQLRIKMTHQGNEYVHMLNSTLCATGRTICAILENFQTDAGVVVPPVLRPYMDGRELMEFV